MGPAFAPGASTGTRKSGPQVAWSKISSGNEGETRPATFDNPAAGSYSVFLGHGNVNDANIAMLDCYHTFFILDLSNTNVTQAGLDSLPNLRAYVLRLRGVRLGDTDGRFPEGPDERVDAGPSQPH